MAPRATVQQAIEMLKIHQIRRENAAIYQQVQNLRDEVSSLHNVSNETQDQIAQVQKDLQGHQARSNEGRVQLEKINTTINDIAENSEHLHRSINYVKEQTKIRGDHSAAQYSLIRDRLDKVERHHDDSDDASEKVYESLSTKMDGLQQALNAKTDGKDFEQIQARVEKLEDKVFMHGFDTNSDMSRIKDSIENAAGKNDRCSSVCKTMHTDPADQSEACCGTEQLSAATMNEVITRNHSHFHEDTTSNTDRLGSEIMLTLQHDEPARQSTVPDDLDLDEEVSHADRTRHSVHVLKHCNSSLKLPHSYEREVSVEKILLLRQAFQEPLVTYIKRGLDLLEDICTNSDDIIIRRLVDGLANEQQRNAFDQWLTQTSWSRQNLKDIACLHGVSRHELSAFGHTASKAGTGALKEPVVNQPADVLVPATESLDRDHHSTVSEVTNGELQLAVLRPRRSQRLAAKSQAQAQTTPTQTIETVSQAMALDARVAKAAKQHKLYPGQPSCQGEFEICRDVSSNETCKPNRFSAPRNSRKRKRVGDQTDTKTSAAIADDIHVTAQKRKQRSLQTTSTTVADAEQNQNILAPESVLIRDLDIPHTPARKIFIGNDSKEVPFLPHIETLSPLHGRKVKSKHNQRLLQQEQTKAAKQFPIPYHPQPRLVSKICCQKSSTYPQQLTSDSDVFLPGPKQPVKQYFRETSRQGLSPLRKQQRRALPPPPEIPILSTSTEEDRRFDHW